MSRISNSVLPDSTGSRSSVVDRRTSSAKLHPPFFLYIEWDTRSLRLASNRTAERSFRATKRVIIFRDTFRFYCAIDRRGGQLVVDLKISKMSYLLFFFFLILFETRERGENLRILESRNINSII